MDEVYSVPLRSNITPIKPLNDSLTLCKCYVMAIGKNDNFTDIPKDACDAATPTLYNIPVVGHLYKNEDGDYVMGGHDIALKRDGKGKYTVENLTVPYGVVPQQDNVHYEDIIDPDGVKRTYQVADVILWTGRYPELLDASYNDKVFFSQSMEIKPTKKTKEGKYTRFDEYQYRALCLLGKSDDEDKTVEPCFPSASVEAYEFEKSDVFEKLVNEFMYELRKYNSAADAEKGGNETMEMQPDKVVEPTPGGVETEEVIPPASEETPTEVVKFSVERTYEEKRIGLSEAVKAMSVWTEDLYADYWMIDFDSQYVYVSYHECGKDVPENHETLRFSYTEVDGGFSIMPDPVLVRQCWLTKEDEEKLAADKQELELLIEFKNRKLDEEKRAAYSEVLSEFSDLAELDEYKLIMKSAMEFESKDELEEKLYALRGKFSKRPAKKSLSEIHIPVGNQNDKPKSDGQLFMEKYLAHK